MGITFKYKGEFKEYIKKRFVRLLIPYFSFALISILIMYVIGKIFPSIVDGEETQIIPNILGALYGNGLLGYMKWNLPLWFLPCSFVVCNIIYIVEMMIDKIWAKKKNLVRIVFVVISFSLNYLYCLFFRDLKLPFGSEVAISMSGFFMLGVILNTIKIHITNTIKIIVSIILLISSFVFANINNGVSVMSLKFGKNLMAYYCIAIMAIIGICLLSMWITNIRKLKIVNGILAYCGMHTIAILCMHKFPIILFQYIVPYTKNLMRSEIDSVNKNFMGFIVTSLIILLCLIVELFIDRICPFILGKKMEKKVYRINKL